VTVGPFDGVALRLGGGRCVLGPLGVLLVHRSLRLAEAVARRDGVTFDASVAAALAELTAVVGAEAATARTSANGSAELPPEAGVPPSPGRTLTPGTGGLSTQDVADALSITTRGARALAERGTLRGVKLGGSWVLDPEDVAVYARLRDERKSA
jgi:hypothetical protein